MCSYRLFVNRVLRRHWPLRFIVDGNSAKVHFQSLLDSSSIRDCSCTLPVFGIANVLCHLPVFCIANVLCHLQSLALQRLRGLRKQRGFFPAVWSDGPFFCSLGVYIFLAKITQILELFVSQFFGTFRGFEQIIRFSPPTPALPALLVLPRFRA